MMTRRRLRRELEQEREIAGRLALELRRYERVTFALEAVTVRENGVRSHALLWREPLPSIVARIEAFATREGTIDLFGSDLHDAELTPSDAPYFRLHGVSRPGC